MKTVVATLVVLFLVGGTIGWLQSRDRVVTYPAAPEGTLTVTRNGKDISALRFSFRGAAYELPVSELTGLDDARFESVGLATYRWKLEDYFAAGLKCESTAATQPGRIGVLYIFHADGRFRSHHDSRRAKSGAANQRPQGLPKTEAEIDAQIVMLEGAVAVGMGRIQRR